MGAIRKNGPIFIIFCEEIWDLLRTQNTKLQLIRRKNTKNTEVPLYGGYQKKWTHIYNFLFRHLVPNENPT